MPIVKLPSTPRFCVFSPDNINAFPDIPAAMLNWALRVHPNERELTRMSSEWFARLDFVCVTGTVLTFSITSYNMLPPHRYNEWVTSEFGLLAAMCYPDAPDEKLRCVSLVFAILLLTHYQLNSNSICMDFLYILFSYDDLMDVPGKGEDTKYMHNAHGVEKAAQMLIRIFKKPEEFRPVETLPVLTTYHESVFNLGHHCR